MRIGILTFHHTRNYGANLQSVSLCRQIRALGFDAEVIDYRTARLVGADRRWSHQPLKWLLNAKKRRAFGWRGLILEWRARRRRLARMTAWRLKQGTTSPSSASDLTALNQLSQRYDVLVVGSDEVWNTRGWTPVDLSFFLGFGRPEAVRISYAACAGPTTSFAEVPTTGLDSLRRFQHLSVRDEPTLDVLRRETAREATLVVDPAFFFEHDPQSIPGWTGTRYAVVTGVGALALLPTIKAYCASHGLRCVVLDGVDRRADHSVGSPDQGEWLDWIAGAHIVFTSLYHATVFSIKFQREFVLFCPLSKRGKVESLLTPLCLTDRVLGATLPLSIADATQQPIDWAAVTSKLQPRIDASRAWLRSALTSVADH